MNRRFGLCVLTLAITCVAVALAQSDAPVDERPFVKGGIGDKPFVTRAGRTSLGGYTEAHFRYERAEGLTEELTFVPKRINLFTFTPVSERVRVASEIEFEEGGEEIIIELASVDFDLTDSVSFRAGMLLSPLGRFNLAHDSPANELTDRPLVATELLGVALSEPGMGFFGAWYPSPSARLTYELYAVNGFGDGVLVGDEAGTRIPAGKGTIEDNNTTPSLVGRVAYSPGEKVEIGVSGHHGPYNASAIEGLEVDESRDVTLFVIDAEARVGRATLRGEYAQAEVDVPTGFMGIFAESQRGFYAEAVVPFGAGWLASMPESGFAAVARYGRVDFNADVDGDSIGRLTLGANFRPQGDTAFKLDYQRTRERDGFNNKADSAALLFSVASYF
ncbi:hypothetical protein HN371_26850 [Candidatus Poribacteria bacterium]|nr:hypothetical protein [Candidatus Poribacteria bacterium]MBT5714461.1 hypothetical protein [Candidatus Poribacteria bacterium]MBT7101218.1 hypothetical protein [Candidatus Poribacteria bacterium]MBT7806254.1 hypothetical protein [Candidatus Poribacteria bacterium]